MGSLFYLYGCGNHHDHIDVDLLDAGAIDVDKDHVALDLGYYD
jgi:hypothetical protein